MSSQEKFQKKVWLWIICWVILLILIWFLINYSKNNSKEIENQPVSEESKEKTICEQKIINDFQLIEPEFSWTDNPNIDENTLKWSVIYYEWDDIFEETDFLCTISANTNDARIERDIDEDDYYNEEEVIYDDREEWVDNTRAEVEARFQRDGHL